MSEEIIKVLDNLAGRFGIAIDWTSQNVMPYLQELLTRFQHYKIAIATIFLSLEILALIVAIVCIVKGKKKKKESASSYWEWIDEGALYFWIIVIVFIVLIISVPITIDMLLKGIYLPELLILDYLKGN